MIKNIINKLKNVFSIFGGLFLWISPLTLFFLVTYLPKILWNPSFTNYIEFLKILVWPYTVLVILFFFKKVVTYLFFSMDEFNFFGAKGNLKNVNEVILEEVNKKFLEKENEEKRKNDMEKLNAEIKIKESELSKTKGTADENLDLAREIMKEWKKSTEQNKKTILNLDTENKRLKEIVSSLPTNNSPLDVQNIELGSGEKVEDLTLGNPK